MVVDAPWDAHQYPDSRWRTKIMYHPSQTDNARRWSHSGRECSLHFLSNHVSPISLGRPRPCGMQEVTYPFPLAGAMTFLVGHRPDLRPTELPCAQRLWYIPNGNRLILFLYA